MKVLITLDHYDGSQGKTKEFDLESIRINDLVFAMTSKDVCGFTVTKLDSPEKLMTRISELP